MIGVVIEAIINKNVKIIDRVCIGVFVERLRRFMFEAILQSR